MEKQWIDYCTQLLQTDMLAAAITWGIVLTFFLTILIAFWFFKPLKRFKSKANVVLPIIIAAFTILALVDIVPKAMDISKQSFITVENALVQRYHTHRTPFDSNYIDVYSAEYEHIVRLDNSSLIPFDENPETTYTGLIIYAEHSKTLLYADVK